MRCPSPLFMGDLEQEDGGEYLESSEDDGGGLTANKSTCATRPDISTSLSANKAKNECNVTYIRIGDKRHTQPEFQAHIGSASQRHGAQTCAA